MAPTLTSNSFLLTTTPRSRTTLRNPKLAVFAKKLEPKPEESQNPTPFKFNFNFNNLPDVKSLVPVVANPSSGLSFGNQRRKDPGTVFVAGATGQAGVRIAQILLRQGFSVRAGVPDLGAAQELARLAASYKLISNEESKRLNAVNSNFEDAESIAKAIGNASKVVVTIGPSENGPTSEVTTSDALQVIQAAELANVSHVAIVYDGSSANESTYNVLDGIQSFFNNIFSKSQPLTIVEFLQKLVETTDLSYTLIKTKLTEDFSPECSYNLVVSPEGSAAMNDYKVAKSQIASLVADVFSNTAIAENKVVEVFTDPSAPSKAFTELFSGIPEDGRRKAYAESLAKAKAEEEAIKATEQAREAAEAAKELEVEVKKLEKKEARAASLAAEAQKKAEAAGESYLGKAEGKTSGISWGNLSSQLKSAVEKLNVNEEEPSLAAEAQKKVEAAGASFLGKAENITSGISWGNLSSQLKSAVEKFNESEEEPKVQVATVRGQAKARSLPSLKAVVKNPVRSSPAASKSKGLRKPKAKETEPKKETRNVFGGLFKQETIYIDDD